MLNLGDPKVGLTLGKFLPFHQGHELLIQTAASCVDILFVLIGVRDDDPFTFKQRKAWVEEAAKGLCPILNIVEQPEIDNDAPKDADGTITDENYWTAWVADTKMLTSAYKLTHVFTSDLYGERIARELDAQWCPVDPDREIIPISGTKTRNATFTNFRYLPDYVKPSFVKKIALVGSESVGKSTLARELAQTFSCPWVPEYGRTICKPRNNDLTRSDFDIIIHGQDMFIKNAVKRATDVPMIITDTEALTTAMWAEMMEIAINYDPYFDFANHQEIDLYLLMAPTVPWVQDGTRMMTAQQRQLFHNHMIEELIVARKNYVVIDQKDFLVRKAMAIAAIMEFMEPIIGTGRWYNIATVA